MIFYLSAYWQGSDGYLNLNGGAYPPSFEVLL